VLGVTLLLAFPSSVQAAAPDLTAPGVIATIDKTLTYNLGPTGLRGWIYISGGNVGADGTITAESRQILVTVASTPGSAVLAVDDVILGVGWGTGSDPVPVFISDARKSFGWAIGEAEKTANSGILRIKRWRGGVTTDVAITLPVMGSYTDTAPYTCPKSAQILANARNKLVSQLLADPNFLGIGWSGAINGLALLAGVAPGDPNYATVQTRLQTFARSAATTGPQNWGLPIWDWGYMGLFLAEYYLSTGDTNVVPGINSYTVTLAQSQSMYGTFGHGPSVVRPDGSGRRSVAGYGPVNQCGIPANIAIVIGKKALVAAGQPIDAEIDPAIQRGSDFFAWYVNKGSIPYGEHVPGAENHGPNGKDAQCAVLFGVQDNRLTETEYFTRMTTAGFNDREYGHTGQGFSYLWGAMGANMGGTLAVAEYLKNVRWHHDLERRSDGSFVYDGQEQYGAGSTADGTYLGESSYYGLNATASYILTYGLPLQRLYITGKNANPANTLDPTKVANAIAAATFKQDCHGFTTTQLIAALSEFDPVVRYYAAIELATRSLTPTELTTLRTMLTGTNANGRMGACQTLGILKDATAMPMLTQRLDKNLESDSWVRAAAASALRLYTTATASSQLTPMLNAFIANATDPDVIVWSDPLQASNTFLGFALWGDAIYGYQVNGGANLGTYTINAAKSLLYPAVKAGLKQPDSYSRQGASDFVYNKLTLADVRALPLDFINIIQYECQVDRMWSAGSRARGIQTLAKHKIAEGIPLALAMLEVPAGFEWGSGEYLIPALNVLASYGDAARWTLPALRGYLGTWGPQSSEYATLVSTIASIEAAITSPAGITNLKAVANSQLVTTTGAKAITLTGTSCRDASVTFTHVTAPAHGTLTGTAPNLTYTPTAGYTGPDSFTFQTMDVLTTSEPATVSVIVGTAGTGLKGEYFDNLNFTNLKLTRTDAQVNFDWGTGSPNALIAADTFSVRWSGLLLVPETGTYTFSTLNSDGVRLYVNGLPVIDDYVDQTTNWKDGASVNLTAGQMVDLQLEYYENTGSAVAKLKWTGPSFAGANGAIIAKEWLYDGTGMTRTPYAHAQTVTLVQNTAQAVTLTGSGGALTYSVITAPAHGFLTGVAPNLTYTPAANYSGTDSFTFLVNNGTSNSSPATVSISIWAGLPVSYTWKSATSGNWSVAGNWTPGAPAAAGQPFYNLNFTPSGTYTVTQDLNNGFLLNQLNMAGAVTLAGTNSLAFAANGTLLPQFNQNSSNAVTVSAPVNLTAMTSFGGTGGGTVTLSSLISGTGGLTKDSPGMLQLYGLSPNTYSGGTVVNSGTLHLGAYIDGISPYCVNPAATGPVTLNGGTIEFDNVAAANALTVNGGTLYSPNGWGATWSGPITLNATLTCNTPYRLTCSAAISGTGGLNKTSGDTLKLSGSNSYTGPTTVTDGTVQCDNLNALGTGALSITSGAKVALNYTGTRVIAALTLAGTSQLPGTYGSTASPAANKNNSYFSGTGTVTILPATTTALALTSGATPADPGMPLTFTATVTGSSPTGSVKFYDGTTLLGSSALNGSFQAIFTTSSLAIGSHSITAQYAGNATNAASTSAAVAIEITSLLAPPPVNLFATPGNNSIALSWTVSAGATSYYVKRSPANGGPYTVIGNPNTASYSDLTVANGTTYYYVVSAINGAGESANSAQASAIPAPLPSTTTVTSSLGNAATYGDAVTFTATVAVTGGPATGTVTFKDGTTVLGSGTLDGSGQATYTPGALAVASHPITATFAGDATFGPSISPGFIYAVSAKSVTIDGMTVSNKVYDGTAAATLSGGALSGVLGGDSVTVVPGNGTFASPNAGTWAVTASGFSLGGGSAGNYVLSAQPALANASITARPLVLSGTRVYDATASAAAASLTISNKLSGDDLTLTGSTTLAGKDVGAQAFLANYATPVRVRSATGFSAGSSSTSFAVTLSAAPANGNTLIAVISSRSTSTDRVTGITSTGATWARVAQSANSSGSTTEIWSAPVGSGAATSVTIATLSGRCAGVVIEYSGILTASAVDQTAASPGGNSTSPVTGTTPITTQANELWIGGVGFRSSAPTMNTLLNSFTSVASAQSGSTTATSNAKVYALESIVSTTGTATSGGTLTASVIWSGAIATFKAASTSTLGLTGTSAANYTLAGATGSVTITPKALTLTATPAVAGKPYDGLTAATLTGATLRVAQAAGTGTTLDGTPYTGDALTLALSGTFDTRDAAAGKPVTSTSTLSGANAGNYTLTQPTGLSGTITPAGLTITAGDQGKTYGQTLAFGSGATQFTSNGLQNGETIGSVTMTCAGGGAAAGVAGSPYPMTPSAATGGTFSAGNYTINYVPGLLTVSAAATTTTLTTSGSPGTYGIPVTLTATVIPTLSGGTVQFHDNAVALGSPVPLGGGQAQLATSTLATGDHSITATYSGTTNYNGSTATAMTQTVTKATPTITTPPTATDITCGQTLESSTLSGGAASVAGAFAFTAPTTAPSAGTASHSVTFTPGDTDNYQTATTSASVTVNAAQSTYSAWAADPAQGLSVGVNDGPNDDPDHDGVSNLMEFVLGGAPMVPSQAHLPALTKAAGAWVFEYERSDLSLAPATTQIVEYGDDLTGWTAVPIPEISNTEVAITPGSPSDHVKVTIPNPGTKVFVRLKVTQQP